MVEDTAGAGAPGTADDVFAITIEYRKDSQDPARVFRAMSGLIDAIFQLERHLAHSLHTSLEPVLLLQDVQTGSIRTVLRTVIRALDPDVPLEADWEPRAKRYIATGIARVVEFMDGRETIRSREEVSQLSADLLELAAESQVTELPSYEPVEPKRLLEDVSQISEAASNLSADDSATIDSVAGSVKLNQGFRLTAEEIEDLLTNEVVDQTRTMVLVVKKPDYLGQSMWQLKSGNHTIDAKLQDKEWLETFQARRCDLRPGDAIKAVVRSEIKLDVHNVVIAEHYYVLRVLDIIPVDRVQQPDFFGPPDAT